MSSDFRRFYCPQLADSDGGCGARVELTGEESHHLRHVLRARVGTRVQLFDGKGRQTEAVVTHFARGCVHLECGEIEQVSRESARRLVLATALPRSGRERFLVEKAVELGVAEVWFFEAQRGVARCSSGFLKKAERTVIEASKQCGRNTLMPVRCRSLDEILSGTPTTVHRWMAHPGGPFWSPERTGAEATESAILIGPEGGFTESEVGRAQSSGWELVSLGPRVLRIETAALALAAALLLGGDR